MYFIYYSSSKLPEELAVTLEQVVVFPLPWRPTNMMTLFLPLVGVQAFTPGSTSWSRGHRWACHRARTDLNYLQDAHWAHLDQLFKDGVLDHPPLVQTRSHLLQVYGRPAGSKQKPLTTGLIWAGFPSRWEDLDQRWLRLTWHSLSAVWPAWC